MRIFILTLHGIGTPQRTLDSEEADVWIDIPMFQDVLELAQSCPTIRLTFDDGNTSDITVAYPELVRRRLSAIFFTVASRIGQPGFLAEGDLRTLAAAGMLIGSHGFEHCDWRELSRSTLSRELTTSMKVLSDVVGYPVTTAACPHGSYDHRVLNALRRAGYKRVYTSDRGWTNVNAWLQARNTVRAFDFANKVRSLVERRGYQNRVVHRLKLLLKRWR